MSSGIITDYLKNLITRQIEDHGLVVWFDPEKAYLEVAQNLTIPETAVLRYSDGFVRLRREIDQQGLMDGEEPPRLLVYVPMSREDTHHALIELEAAGVVMGPGLQPVTRNTRLAVVGRNALKPILGEATAADVEKQTEAGKLTLADLDALADKGGEISKGVITLIFQEGNNREIALTFLNNDRLDETIIQKDAKGQLVALLRREFDFEAPDHSDLEDLRRRLARHVLMTDFIKGLGEAVPDQLASAPSADAPAAVEACAGLASSWRLRRDLRDGYVSAARHVEDEFNLKESTFQPESLQAIETFPVTESVLLRHAENRLLEKADDEILAQAESRLSCFWCDAVPSFQVQWALVVSAARVLLAAQEVEKQVKSAPPSTDGLIRQYSEGLEPWCLLDTYHRLMESAWHDFEFYGSDHDSLEKLIIKARLRYAAVGSEMAHRFLRELQKSLPGKGIARQSRTFQKHVEPALNRKKTAYVWVDALRYEMGRELARLLDEDFKVDLQASVAAVPTITEIGMAALLPDAHVDSKIVSAGGGSLAVEINGTTIKDRKDRMAFIKARAGVEFFDVKLDNLLPKPLKKVREAIEKAELILVTSQEIDELCEQDNIGQARSLMNNVLHNLCRGVRVLADLGVEHIVLTADHGHIFADELSEDMKVDPPGGETIDLHRRVWIGRGGEAGDAFLRMPLKSFGMESDFDLAAPWTFACFKCKGGARAYFHGGLSLQELLVPILILRPLERPSAVPSRKIAWKLIPGSKKITTHLFSVRVEGVNLTLFDILPPKVRIELRAKGKAISETLSAAYGFDDDGRKVLLQTDERNPKKILSNTVILKIIELPEQKTVSLHLLDDATGAELARLDKLEMAIAL